MPQNRVGIITHIKNKKGFRQQQQPVVPKHPDDKPFIDIRSCQITTWMMTTTATNPYARRKQSTTPLSTTTMTTTTTTQNTWDTVRSPPPHDNPYTTSSVSRNRDSNIPTTTTTTTTSELESFLIQVCQWQNPSQVNVRMVHRMMDAWHSPPPPSNHNPSLQRLFVTLLQQSIRMNQGSLSQPIDGSGLVVSTTTTIKTLSYGWYLGMFLVLTSPFLLPIMDDKDLYGAAMICTCTSAQVLPPIQDPTMTDTRTTTTTTQYPSVVSYLQTVFCQSLVPLPMDQVERTDHPLNVVFGTTGVDASMTTTTTMCQDIRCQLQCLVTLVTFWNALGRLEELTSSCTTAKTLGTYGDVAAWWMLDNVWHYYYDTTTNGHPYFLTPRQEAWTAHAAMLAVSIILWKPNQGNSQRPLDNDDGMDLCFHVLGTNETSTLCPSSLQISRCSVILSSVSFLLHLLQYDGDNFVSWLGGCMDATVRTAVTRQLYAWATRRHYGPSEDSQSDSFQKQQVRTLSWKCQHLLLLWPHVDVNGAVSDSYSTDVGVSTRMLEALRHLLIGPEASQGAVPTNPTSPQKVDPQLLVDVLETWCVSMDATHQETANEMVRQYCCYHDANVSVSLLADQSMVDVGGQFWDRCLQALNFDPDEKGSETGLSSITTSDEQARYLRVGIFLLVHFPVPARRGLMTAICGNENPMVSQDCDSSLQTGGWCLLQLLLCHDGVTAAAMLRTLLGDRESPVKHDELSRYLWQSVTPSFVTRCLEVTLSAAKEPRHNHRSLCLLDCMSNCLRTVPPSFREQLLSSTSAELVESMIGLIGTRGSNHGIALVDASMAMDIAMTGSEGTTPPADNLSRIEASDETPDQTHAPTLILGISQKLSLAAATLLSILSQTSFDCKADNRTILLRGRMRDAVCDFLNQEVRHGKQESSMITTSLPDVAGRWFSLLRYYSSSPENEDFVNTVLYSETRSVRQMSMDLQRQISEQKELVEASKAREKKLLADLSSTKALLSNLRVQASNRERIVDQNAQQLVAVHQKERQRAEERSRESLSRVKEMEGRSLEAEQQAERSRKAEDAAKVALTDTERKLSEAKSNEEYLKRQLQDISLKYEQSASELRDANEQVSCMMSKEEEMKAHIRSQEESMEQMEDSYRNMRESLESLFSDLVCLAQMYEQKEKQVSSLRQGSDEKITKLTKQLEAERSRSTSLADKYRQTESENDMLSRKYAKVREKLEKERNDRQREEKSQRKQRDPISYINQLHQSTSLGKSANDSSRFGKENDLSSSLRTSRSRSYR